MAVYMDGKLVSQQLRQQLRQEVAELSAGGHTPGLAVVLVGENEASKVYVRGKHKACEEVGIHSEQYTLPAETTEAELLALVETLNQKEDIHGILVQLPLPSHLDEKVVINAISPEKDVDAFHPSNVGRIMLGDYTFLPCTPAGIMALLAHYEIPLEGKHCVVIGRSNIVGKPMSMLLLHKNATVTICHSRTADLAAVTRQADVLVAAVGRARFVTPDMVKEGAVVVDVGMNRDENGRLCGDVDFAAVEPLCTHITPVPGGVGPMTITTLLQNTVTSAVCAKQMGQR